MTFLKRAMNADTFAWPRATKVAWHADWIPKTVIPRKYVGMTCTVRLTRASLLVKMPAYTPGATTASPQSTNMPVNVMENILRNALFTLFIFPAP